MEFIEQKIKDVWEIRLNPIKDHRGFFMRTYDSKSFQQHRLNTKWVQENHSLSTQKGTLRGLHFQLSTFAETKLVRTIKGEVFDVFVDLRENSSTFGKWGAIILSHERKNMAYIPRGFAHGFMTLSDITEVIYKVDNFYAPEYEGGISWNDPELAIEWPISNPILSEKDKSRGSFTQFCKVHESIIIRNEH